MIGENDSRFITLPSLEPSDVLCTRHFNVELNSNHNIKCELKSVQRGESYEEYSGLTSYTNKNITDMYIRNTILSGSYELNDYTFENQSGDEPVSVLKAEIKMSNLYKEYGNNFIITQFSCDIPNYEAPDKRKQDVQINYPVFFQDTVIYTIPGKLISKIPDDVKIESPFGHYHLNF